MRAHNRYTHYHAQCANAAWETHDMRKFYYHRKRLKRYQKKVLPSVINTPIENRRFRTKTTPIQIHNTPHKVAGAFTAHFAKLLEASPVNLYKYVSQRRLSANCATNFSPEVFLKVYNGALEVFMKQKAGKCPGLSSVMYEAVQCLPLPIVK